MKPGTCFARNSVPMRGTIDQMTAPWLFQDLRTQSKTGTAVFEFIQEKSGAKVVKKVYFSKGDITFAASNLQEDWLGRWLVRTGRLTEQQCAASEELVAKTGRKQGAILVELGFLTPATLIDGVKLQVKQIILGVFRVRMGTYRFDEGPLPMADIIPLQMSTGNVILEGVTDLDWKDIRKAMPPPTDVIRPATDPSCLFQDAHLTADQKAVFALVDGKRTIEEICGASGVGDFNALKVLYLLLALRMIEVGAVKNAADADFVRDAVQEAVGASAERGPDAPPGPELVVTREKVQQAHASMARQDHYEVLGVARTASPRELKHAYFRLAKGYHPDRHFDPAMADLKTTLETLFDHIHKAYETLSSPEKRAAYDRELSSQAAKSGGFVERHAEEYVENYAEKAARAAEQFRSGMHDFKRGNYWSAVELFTWATRLDPLKAPYFFYHGLCLVNIPRRRHEAEESLQKAIELDPTKAEYHIELSNLYLKSGVKTKSLLVLNNALKHLPDSPRISDAIAAAGEGKPYA